MEGTSFAFRLLAVDQYLSRTNWALGEPLDQDDFCPPGNLAISRRSLLPPDM